MQFIPRCLQTWLPMAQSILPAAKLGENRPAASIVVACRGLPIKALDPVSSSLARLFLMIHTAHNQCANPIATKMNCSGRSGRNMGRRPYRCAPELVTHSFTSQIRLINFHAGECFSLIAACDQMLRHQNCIGSSVAFDWFRSFHLNCAIPLGRSAIPPLQQLLETL